MINRFVAMGVSGCGKSTIGAAFAEAIGATFVDGDKLHPQSNIDKMSRGEPLNDMDRAPWLADVGRALSANTVIACSALKYSYRDLIRQEAGAPVVFLSLQGSRALLLERVSNRPGHFMPPALLDSQLDTFEPLRPDEHFVIADIANAPDEIVAHLIQGVESLKA